MTIPHCPFQTAVLPCSSQYPPLWSSVTHWESLPCCSYIQPLAPAISSTALDDFSIHLDTPTNTLVSHFPPLAWGKVLWMTTEAPVQAKAIASPISPSLLHHQCLPFYWKISPINDTVPCATVLPLTLPHHFTSIYWSASLQRKTPSEELCPLTN